jgi:hypothetical protein
MVRTRAQSGYGTQDIDAKFDHVEVALPQMVKHYPYPGDFWNEFACETDYLFENAGGLYEHVRGCIDKMLEENYMIPSDG